MGALLSAVPVPPVPAAGGTSHKILVALRAVSGWMRMAVRMWPADVGRTWFCETVHKIDAGSLAFGCSRLRREREYQSLCSFQGSAGGMRAGVVTDLGGSMQVIYERCAAVDVGKDVIAIAVRLPGGGPGGRDTVKRTFKTFYGVLAEAARWLVSLGSPMWRWRRPGSIPCRSITPWSSTGTLRRCWCATPGMSRTCRAARPTR